MAKPISKLEFELCLRCRVREIETRTLCLVCWTDELTEQIGQILERVTELEIQDGRFTKRVSGYLANNLSRDMNEAKRRLVALELGSPKLRNLGKRKS